MAGNLQTYTLAYVYVDGLLMAEESSLTLGRKSNSQQVNTTAKGYSGESPGSILMDGSFEAAVPATGFELDVSRSIRELRVHEFQFFAANAVLTTKGYFLEDSFNHAVDSASKISYTLRLEYADWQNL